jgi:tetratricopeptide (TPR) repeat protein
MRGRALVASVTCLAFTMLVVWPRGAAAQGKGPAPAASAPAAAPAAPAPANDDAVMAQAKQHFEAGRNAYNAGDYVTAIREFKEAERLRPSPILAYNIGLANEKLGKRRVAVKYYKRYLELQPNAANKAEVEQKIAALEQEIAAQPPPAATAQPGGTAPQPQGQAQAIEQPGDMPPPDPNAQAVAQAQAQPGYDPYASQSPPGQTVKPAKKKSYWWIGLIIGGAVTVTVVIAVVIWLYAVNTTYYVADRGLTTVPDANARMDKHDIGGLTLFRF